MRACVGGDVGDGRCRCVGHSCVVAGIFWERTAASHLGSCQPNAAKHHLHHQPTPYSTPHTPLLSLSETLRSNSLTKSNRQHCLLTSSGTSPPLLFPASHGAKLSPLRTRASIPLLLYTVFRLLHLLLQGLSTFYNTATYSLLALLVS